VSYFILWFPHCQIFSLSGRFLFWEIKTSHTVQSQEYMEVDAWVEFRVWLRGVAQVETSVLMCCHGGFANSLTTTSVDVCEVLCCRDAAELVNNIPSKFCDPLEQIHDAQPHLYRRKQ
jgi:hypothetical protein